MVILNSKLSKYKEIEKKQEAIIREMDDAISAYLVEVKDENDRLIKELTIQSTAKKTEQGEREVFNEYSRPLVEEKTTTSSEGKLESTTAKVQQLILEPIENHAERVIDVPKITPKTVAANAYRKQLPDTPQRVQPVEQYEIMHEQQQNSVASALSQFEQNVVDYHRLGMSIEEIAKKTQKGKTEIELLIKFHA